MKAIRIRGKWRQTEMIFGDIHVQGDTPVTVKYKTDSGHKKTIEYESYSSYKKELETSITRCRSFKRWQ